jgi:hypothetical protein
MRRTVAGHAARGSPSSWPVPGPAEVDASRLGGLDEVLLADKFGVSVCPHAGGLGLCEYVRQYATVA